MTTDCPFLVPLQLPPGRSTYGCGAGISFCEVGEDRNLCRVCSVAFLGRLPDCSLLDAYAWLEGYPTKPCSSGASCSVA